MLELQLQEVFPVGCTLMQQLCLLMVYSDPQQEEEETGVFLKSQFLYKGQYRCGILSISLFSTFFSLPPPNHWDTYIPVLVAFWVYFSNYGFVNKQIWLCSVLVYRSLEGVKKAVPQASNNQIIL